MKRVYVGPKQLTIENTNFFDYSVTLFGDTNDKNISYKVNNLDNVLEFEYWNPDSNPREINIYNELLSTIKEPFEIMAHDYKIVSQCNIPKNAKLICKNSDELIKLFNNKTETRNLFKGIIPTLDYTYVKGKDFNFKELSPEGKTLVVQHPLGSGGSKTFLCKKESEQSVKEKLLKNETYAISTYLEENIPYNIHCVIGKNDYEIFPPSMQELDVIDKIEYIGSFYDIKIEDKVKQKFIDYTKKICEKLQELGYLGVLGIDYIYANNELYFIEINPRFQGSTRQLDKILIETLKDKDKKLIGGIDNLRSKQGFYIYRNKRLIIWGTWFGMNKRAELTKNARIRVDIPNTLDDIWSIDIMKQKRHLLQQHWK